MKNFGNLQWENIKQHMDLVAPSVAEFLLNSQDDTLLADVFVTTIEGEFADTLALMQMSGIGAEHMGNCVLVRSKGVEPKVVACVALANTRVDVNHVVKKKLGSRCSFMPYEAALEYSGMEYGGITPLGLPKTCQIYIDSRVLEVDVIIGSGKRTSKILLSGKTLVKLTGAEVIENLAFIFE